MLFLHDLTRCTEPDYQAADQDIAKLLQQQLPARVPVLDVYNKVDTAPPTQQQDQAIYLSAKQGTGLDALRQRLLTLAGWQSAAEGVYMARERHVQALKRVHEHMAQAAAHLAAKDQHLDLLAEELRLSQEALNEITGEFTSDDLLGVIFSKFCIGK